MSTEEIDEKIEELLPSDVINGMCDANWKTRLSSMETFISSINDLNSKPNISQILIKTILKKPGLKVCIIYFNINIIRKLKFIMCNYRIQTFKY